MTDNELRAIIRAELEAFGFVRRDEVEAMIEAKLDERTDVLRSIALSVDTYLRTAEVTFGEWGAKLVDAKAKYDASAERQNEAYSDFRQASDQFRIAAAKLEGSTQMVSEIRSDVERIEDRITEHGEMLAGLRASQDAQDERTERLRRAIYGNPAPDGTASMVDMLENISSRITGDVTSGLTRIEGQLASIQEQVDINTRFRATRMAIEAAIIRAPITITKAVGGTRLGQSILWLFTSRLGWLTMTGIVAILALLSSGQPLDIESIVREIERALTTPAP